MGTSERRNEILRLLCLRRYDTISNLAFEFGVSERTIRRDIEMLSLTEPIYTQTGRYGGGVYVVEGYNRGKIYMSEKEIDLLHKLCYIAQNQDKCILSSDEFKVLKRITAKYSKPSK